jgi:NADP-dependent 3-hydroxy acid dehydrogenase YdfG
MAATKWTVQQIPSQTGKTALVTGANSGIGYRVGHTEMIDGIAGKMGLQ